MAFPSIAASNTYSSTGASTHAVNMPSGVSAGDLLIVYFACRNDNGDSLAVTSGTDWVKLAENREGTDFLQAAWFAKVATGSGDNLTIDSGNAAGDVVAISLRITDHGVSDPSTDLTVSADFEAGDATADPANCNPGVAADYLWLEGAAGHGSVITNATYWSTNYTGVAQLRSALTNAVVAGVAYRQLNAASEDPGAMTHTAFDGSVAHTLAVPPISAPSTKVGLRRFTGKLGRYQLAG